MKVLFLNGSPRRKGMGAQYLREMESLARHQGAETDFLNIGEMNVHPCLGCEACREKRECILPKDDSVLFLEKLRQADVLVLCSPCYIYNMSGQLKVLFDRLVYGLMKEGRWGLPRPLLSDKRALLVVTSTAPTPFNRLLGYTTGTLRALKRVLHLGGIRVIGTLQRGGTKDRPNFTERDRLRAHHLMKRVFS